MPEVDVFDSQGNFTAGFKFKITEYLRTIPLSDEQVESITKALTTILRSAIDTNAQGQQVKFDKVLEPLVEKVKALEGIVEAHENQAKGMLRLIKGVIGVAAFVATLVTIYQANKSDPTTELLQQLLKEVKHANTLPVSINHP